MLVAGGGEDSKLEVIKGSFLCNINSIYELHGSVCGDGTMDKRRISEGYKRHVWELRNFPCPPTGP